MPKSEFSKVLRYQGTIVVADGPQKLLGPDDEEMFSEDEVLIWHVRQGDTVARGRITIMDTGDWTDEGRSIGEKPWHDGPAMASAVQVYVGPAGIQLQTWLEHVTLKVRE